MATLVFMKWNKTWNQICSVGIDNDSISQGANAINQITQCQLVDEKIKGKGIEKHEFVHVKHETLHLLWWRQKHLEWHHRMYFVPHHGSNKKDDSWIPMTCPLGNTWLNGLIYLILLMLSGKIASIKNC